MCRDVKKNKQHLKLNKAEDKDFLQNEEKENKRNKARNETREET